MDVIKPVLVVFECSKDPFGFELDQLNGVDSLQTTITKEN